MRFMMLMIPKGYEKAKPGSMPDAKAVAEMMKYNQCLQQAVAAPPERARGGPRFTLRCRESKIPS